MSLKKWIWRCLKLHRVYSITFNLSNDVSKFREEKRKMFSCVHVLLNSKTRHFHAVVVQWRQRNVHKSVVHVQSCFGYLNLLLDRAVALTWRRGTIVKSNYGTFAMSSFWIWMLLNGNLAKESGKWKQDRKWVVRLVIGLGFSMVRLCPHSLYPWSFHSLRSLF